MKKDRVVSLRMTDQEYKIIGESAKTAKKTISEYVREILFRPGVPANLTTWAIPTTTTTWAIPTTPTWNAGFPVTTGTNNVWYTIEGGMNT